MKRIHLSQGSLLLIIIMILTVGVWALLPAGNAEACTPSVTVTKTTPDDSSAGTLRWAIGAVCTGGTIDFNLTYPATITLNSTNGRLIINKDLTITGPGADKLTISGVADAVEVFYIGSVTVNISGLTISGGFWVSGGGIDNDGTLTVTNCTFSGNSADQGGGIFNDGTLTVTNSTFSGNICSFGCGIYNNEGGTLTVTNSTFSGNSAGEGGAIYTEAGSASLRNTIVANSTSGGNCAGPGTITSLGHNLDSANTCGFSVAKEDLINTNPKLNSLALNAPGTTETFALKSGSPAIDAGDNSNLPLTDQRGAVRIWDGDGNGTAIVDIGAYEYGAPLYVPPGVPTMNNWGMVIFILLAGLGSVYYLGRRRRAEG